MKPETLLLLISGLLPALSANATPPGDLQQTVHSRSEAALAEDRIAAEQAAARSRSGSAFGFELRPKLSENDAGTALRIYLPDRWSRKLMRQQLDLVSEATRLELQSVEWIELMEVYRNFCTCRMLQKQLALYDQELQQMEPWLEKNNLNLQQNQLSAEEYAKFYGDYLSLWNDREKAQDDLLETEQLLRLALGPSADLPALAGKAVIELPPDSLDIKTLADQALRNRADYRQLDAEARSLGVSRDIARSENRPGIDFIQPEFSSDRDTGESTWEVSASIVLWKTRDPDIAAYEKQRMLALAEQARQRMLIEDRLQVLLDAVRTCEKQQAERNQRLTPLLEQLNKNLAVMDAGVLEKFRDLMAVRRRILDVALQTSKMACKQELLAVDLAEELGTLLYRPAPDYFSILQSQ